MTTPATQTLGTAQRLLREALEVLKRGKANVNLGVVLQAVDRSRPKLRKPGPEHPVRGLKVDAPSGALALEDEELVAKGKDLRVECGSPRKKRSKSG